MESPHASAGGSDDAPSRTTPESKLRTVGAAVGTGVLGILVTGLVIAVVSLVGYLGGLSEGVTLVVSTIPGQYVGFVGVGLWLLRRRGFDWDAIRAYIGLRVPTLRELGVVVAGYVLILGLLAAVVGVAIRFLPEPAQNQGAATAASNPEIIPALIVVMFLVVGPCEEFLFRGVVQNRLRETLSPAPAIVIATATFAVVHVVALAGSPTAMLVTVTILFFPALVFGTVYEYTGNLVVPWLLHSTHNSVLLSVLYLTM